MTVSGITLGIIAIVILLFFSAFFSGSETALMSINRIRLKYLTKTEPRRARVIENILHKPEKLIGTILLGNNLVNVAMSALATAIAITIWGDRGIAYITGILTFIILIFAEITPKVYAKYYNERISLITAPILATIMFVSYPLVIALTFISNKILFLLGINVSKIKRPILTEDEVRTCIQIGWDDGSITTDEKEILSRIFTLNDKTVRQVMVPKERMTTININWPAEKILKTVLNSGFSRLPLYNEEKTEIVGSVYAKDILQEVSSKKIFSIKKIIRPPLFVEGSKRIDKLLRLFQAKKIHQAVVLNQKGEVTGLITLEDIIEELVGSIEDEHDQ